MAVLTVSTGDSLPRSVQFQLNGLPRDLTDYGVVCRIETNPVTSKTVTIADPVSGTGTIVWGGIAPGTYRAQFKLTNLSGDEYTEKFTLISESAI